jgi:2-dehydropantoate 2-reductase
MKIAVIGAGAIGSIVAGYLTKSGEDVLLVGRQDHVKAVNANGLRIKSTDGEEVIPVKAGVKMDKEYDLVIFATKTNDMESAYQDNHEFLETCIVLTTQNGVQGDNVISTHFDRDNMISSIVMFGATFMNPGEVVFNFPGDWILGKPYTANDGKLNDVAEVLRKSFSVEISDNIMGMKWLKLFVNFNNCIPALIGKSMQETFADMDFCRLSVMLLKEGVAIVRDAGIELVSLPKFPAERILGMASMPVEQSAGIINKTLTLLSKEPLYGSILQSIMRGRPSEIDFINGEVTHVAKSLQLQSPLNRKIVDLIHKIEEEGKFLEPNVVKKEFNLN